VQVRARIKGMEDSEEFDAAILMALECGDFSMLMAESLVIVLAEDRSPDA
jgi:hypothetical protein